MKKIFILPMLIVPIVAHATGPSAVGQGQTAVVATASAPYQTAAPAQGDDVNVVSASYVKGAYNDAIAAVNKVAARVEEVDDSVGDIEGAMGDRMDFIEGEISDINDDLQNYKEFTEERFDGVYDSFSSIDDDKQDKITTQYNGYVGSLAIDSDILMPFLYNADNADTSNWNTSLVTADAVLAATQALVVRARTTWGSNGVSVVPIEPRRDVILNP